MSGRLGYLALASLLWGSASGQTKEGFIGLNFTTAVHNSKNPFSSTLFNSDTARVETIDSIRAPKWGFEAMFAAPRFIFVIGVQPSSTWLGDRNFRLRYTTLDADQIVTTSDSIQAHFRHGSLIVGLGYRFQLNNRHFDITVVPYWEKQTGRLIIHDSLYAVHQAQSRLSSEQRNSIPDNIRVYLEDLTQERTRNFAFGLRANLSFGITANKGYGILLYVTPRVQYSYLTVMDHLYSSERTRSRGGWSYGGTMGIGLLFGSMAPRTTR